MELIEIDVLNPRPEEAFKSLQCLSMYDIYKDFYANNTFQKPWIGYFIHDLGEVKGVCGFNGPPIDNKVEIAYHTFPQYEGTGVSSKAGALLVKLASKHSEVKNIIAKTAPEENASTRILSKMGFQFTGTVTDHEIGDAWSWIKKIRE